MVRGYVEKNMHQFSSERGGIVVDNLTEEMAIENRTE